MQAVEDNELRASKKVEIEKDLGEDHHFDTVTNYDVIPRVEERYHY